MRKPFSKELYDQDDVAKHQVIKLLKANGYDAEVNPEQYGIDVLATRDGIDYQVEVEVKHNWKGPKFQFPTLHYSERKRKFLSKPDTTWFVTLNHERTHAYFVPGTALVEGQVVVKNTIYTENERFIEVRITDCIYTPLPSMENEDD
jgi:hypothetical protein